MKKHIFALSGRSGSDKTTTIDNACKLFANIQGVEELCCKPNLESPKEDFVRVYKFNGVKVGFSSGGDNRDVVEAGLKELHGCKIMGIM